MYTEEDKERRRQLKREVVEELDREDLARYRLGDIDERLQSYVGKVVMEPGKHNLFELLAVKKTLRMMRRYGVNVTAVRQFFTFYEALYFPGQEGLRQFRLTPVQCYQFFNIFAFWNEGKRIVREVCLFVPRKFSKTTSCASLLVYDTLFGPANAEDYVAANSQDQAKKCFDVVRGCFRKLDPHERYYRVNEMVVKSLRSDRTAFCQALTANARTKDGLNASVNVFDESSQSRDSELWNVLTTSMGIRTNPLNVHITTASDQYDGPFYSLLEGYKGELLGDIEEDDSVFAHIFEPDVDDDEGSEATWRKVHPHLGVTVTMDFYRQEWKRAKRSAEDMLAFRTKLLNMFSENEQVSWISATIARKHMRAFTPEMLRNKPEAMVAIDLSESDDFSAVTWAVYARDSRSFYFHTHYFFPQGALDCHVNEKRYKVWASKGLLTLTPGDVIDYRTIVEYIMDLSRKMKIRRIGYDPWKSMQVVNMLEVAGGSHPLTPVKQTYGEFNAAVEFFEHGIKTDKIWMNDNDINAFCFSGAIIDVDRLENKKPVKREQAHKIDGVITMLMCTKLFLENRQLRNSGEGGTGKDN